MEYKDFIKLVNQTYNNFNWRYGQTIMNVLYSVSKEKYEALVADGYDCYYDDELAASALDKLEKEWI